MTKITLVTGANRGIGRETCRQLALRGFTVVLTGRDPDQGQAAAGSLRSQGLQVVFCRLDVTQPGQVTAARTPRALLSRQLLRA